jgi:hypothetical protein
MNGLHITLPVLIALSLAPGALAQSPAGSWTFKTDQLEDSCTISGEMTIKSIGRPNRFTCTFKAVQTCSGRLPLEIHTTQSCSALQTGSQLVITSRLDKVDKVNPGAMLKGMDQRYAPDNFSVTINPSADRMDGRFESLGEAPVRFRRHEDLVS